MLAKKYLLNIPKQLCANRFILRNTKFASMPHKNNILSGNLASLWVIAGGLIVFDELWNKSTKAPLLEQELPLSAEQELSLPAEQELPLTKPLPLNPHAHVSFMCALFDALKHVSAKHVSAFKFYALNGIPYITVTLFDDYMSINCRFSTEKSILDKETKIDFPVTILLQDFRDIGKLFSKPKKDTLNNFEKYPNVESITVNDYGRYIDFDLRVVNYDRMFLQHSNKTNIKF